MRHAQALESVKIGDLQVLALRGIEAAADALFHDGRLRPGFALAVNPEKVMLARKSTDLRSLLQQATFPYPDGIGVVLAMHLMGYSDVRRVPGCDLWEALLVRCAKESVPVFLLGATEDSLQGTIAKLRINLPSLDLVGSYNGYFQPEDETTIMDQIRSSGARFVSVGLGSPRQERFISEIREHLPEAFFMGVGGTYDAYIGKVKRAPRFWQKLGLEWFYRLLCQPQRWLRQLALVQFVFLILWQRLRTPIVRGGRESDM